MNRSLAVVLILVGIALVLAVVAWIAGIYIDARHDHATAARDSAPKHDTHRWLGKSIYDAMIRRFTAREEFLAERRRAALLRQNRGRP